MDELITKALSGNLGDDQQRIAQIGCQWINLLLRKNLDYGSTIFQPPRLAPGCDAGTAILVRMGDKIDRLANLLKRREIALTEEEISLVSDETIEDTLSDLGAYCLLYLTRPTGESEDIGTG